MSEFIEARFWKECDRADCHSESSTNVRRTLQQNRPQLVRVRSDLSLLSTSYPVIVAPIVEAIDRTSVASIAGSRASVLSDTEFSFDHELVSTRLYRETMARLMGQNSDRRRRHRRSTRRVRSSSSESSSSVGETVTPEAVSGHHNGDDEAIQVSFGAQARPEERSGIQANPREDVPVVKTANSLTDVDLEPAARPAEDQSSTSSIQDDKKPPPLSTQAYHLPMPNLRRI